MSQASPPLFCQAFSLPKRGNSAEEYEDAAAADPRRGRFAIADGAAESSFAALWAQLLVTGFATAESTDLTPWLNWLPALQQRWDATVSGRALPWFAEMKLQQGAFATFLGVIVEPARWRAVAVGDSCLFQIRRGRLHRAFPLTSADGFGTTPWLVGSRTSCGAALEDRSQRAEGDWQTGDRLWLMTDALALWFLEEVERCRGPWQELEGLLRAATPRDAFVEWVGKQRDACRLRNDDVTLMVINHSR
ncbi:MAG TPA: protein phosphatase 2C domain-containing protein [Gemmataceae bacterium]|nr:protein phosphatase 2C domain-containing protein [Gemmataceae bacterium]